MVRMLRQMPLFKLLAIAKTVLLMRRHFRRLEAPDRRRLAALVRRGPGMSRAERGELFRLLGKLGRASSRSPARTRSRRCRSRAGWPAARRADGRPGRRRPQSQRRADRRRDGFFVLAAVHAPQQAALAVVGDERLRLAVVDAEALADRLGIGRPSAPAGARRSAARPRGRARRSGSPP